MFSTIIRIRTFKKHTQGAQKPHYCSLIKLFFIITLSAIDKKIVFLLDVPQMLASLDNVYQFYMLPVKAKIFKILPESFSLYILSLLHQLAIQEARSEKGSSNIAYFSHLIQ